MPRNSKSAFLLVVLLSSGCASHKRVESLQASQSELAAQITQQAELLQLQDAYLRTLQAEYAALRKHIETTQSGSKVESDRPQAAAGAPKVSKSPVAESAPPPPPRVVTDVDGKIILGNTEWVWFDLLKRDLRVAVDADRKFSTLSVTNSQLFERDGREWVSFEIDLSAKKSSDAKVETAQYEAPLVRSVKLRSEPEGQPESRPVVKLTIKIGHLVEDVQFALVQDTSSRPLATLGRSFLRDIALVDSSRKFIQPKHSPR